MTDLWKAFSYDLIELKKRKVDEATFHQAIETQLQLLGWAKYDGEINHKLDIPIGNHHFIQPDITVGKQPDWLFVIEVKKPNHAQQPKDIAQLTSYMRQLKLSVGLYIGDDIELFYDTADARDNAICVYRIELRLEKNPKGEKFIELFSKHNFSKEVIARFCEDCIKAQKKKESLDRIKANLLSAAAAEEIKSYVLSGLQDKYSEHFSSDDLAGMLKGIVFTAKEGDGQQKVATTRKPKDNNKTGKTGLSVKVWIRRNNLNAFGIFDGKGVTVKEGSPIMEESTPKFNRKEWRNDQVRRYAHRVDGKLVMAKDLYFSTPSGASAFCLGSSSNGKTDWTDENGKQLVTYMV